MLWTLALVTVVLWALGVLGSVGGVTIHGLLLVAATMAGAAWWSGRRS